MADRSDSDEKKLGQSQDLETTVEEEKIIDGLESTCQNFSKARPEMTPTSASNTVPPLTIFYGGSVKVFDGIPAEKVMEIMRIAAAAAFGPDSAELKNHEADNISSSPLLPGSLLAQLCPTPKNILCKMQAEFPIARRHSLQRFLEKRRDRIVSKSPYPSSPAVKVENDVTS